MANKRRCLVPETDLVYTIIDVNVKAFLNRFKDKVTNISPLVVAVDISRITLNNLRHVANLFVVYGRVHRRVNVHSFTTCLSTHELHESSKELLRPSSTIHAFWEREHSFNT